MCVICITEIEHEEPKWSCETCSAVTHLRCMLQWALRSALTRSPCTCPACRADIEMASLPGMEGVVGDVIDDDDDDSSASSSSTNAAASSHNAAAGTIVHIANVTIHNVYISQPPPPLQIEPPVPIPIPE